MACFFNSKSWYFHIHMICNFVFTIIISKKILTEHYHSEAVMSSWRFLCSNSVLLLPIVGQCWIVEWISQVVIFVLTTHSLTTTYREPQEWAVQDLVINLVSSSSLLRIIIFCVSPEIFGVVKSYPASKIDRVHSQ